MKGAKRIREISDLTLKNVAEEMGVSVNTVWRWEKGETDPSVEQMKKLCALYECSMDDLLNPPKPSKGEIIRRRRLERAKEATTGANPEDVADELAASRERARRAAMEMVY